MSDLIVNKKANFDYEILEKMEAGIELIGSEVKSIKGHNGSLLAAYVIIRGGEAFLIGANIPPYQAKNIAETYDPLRNRKLLLTKKEIKQLSETENKRGLTIIAISMYNKARKIKVSLGIARGKKKFDKRASIKKRDTDREVNRTLTMQ